MAPLYAAIMATPMLRGFFGMRGIDGTAFGIVVIVVLIWMYVLRWVWATHAFERFFGYAE
jgi:hypothetical protein